MELVSYHPLVALKFEIARRFLENFVKSCLRYEIIVYSDKRYFDGGLYGVCTKNVKCWFCFFTLVLTRSSFVLDILDYSTHALRELPH